MESELHKHLRISVLRTWVIAWNVLLGMGIWVNGGLSNFHSPLAICIMALALLGTAAFALALLLAPSVRTWALRLDGQFHKIRNALWFIALITTAMGAGTVISLVLDWKSK